MGTAFVDSKSRFHILIEPATGADTVRVSTLVECQLSFVEFGGSGTVTRQGGRQSDFNQSEVVVSKPGKYGLYPLGHLNVEGQWLERGGPEGKSLRIHPEHRFIPWPLVQVLLTRLLLIEMSNALDQGIEKQSKLSTSILRMMPPLLDVLDIDRRKSDAYFDLVLALDMWPSPSDKSTSQVKGRATPNGFLREGRSARTERSPKFS